MMRTAALKAWFLCYLAILVASVSGQSLDAIHGAYLGCFDLALLPVNTSKVAKFSSKTLTKCMPYCYGERYSMHAITQSYQCHCIAIVPAQKASLPDSACSAGGKGTPVFYRFRAANTTTCRLAPVPLKASSFVIHYNEQHVEFSTTDDGEPQMVLKQEGLDGARLAVNDGFKMHGHYEVTGKVDGTSGVVTAFYLRSTDVYTLSNHESPFSEIDFEFLNGNPAAPNSIWLNSFRKGMSNGETLLKPTDYQKMLGVSADVTNSNTWLTYGFSWQPDHLVWYLNGVPLLRRKYDEQVTWTEMDGQVRSRTFRPPDAASHITFSLWTDGNQTRAFGGKLDLNKSPYRSYFKRLRRVLCDQKLPSDPAQAAAALGPSWLYASSACSHFPAGSATSPPLSPAQQASSSASGLGNAAAGSVIAESGSVTAAAAPMPSLTDFTPNGKTLVTNLATPGGSSQSASSSQLCLELWRGPSSGGSVSKVGIYACSSHSPVWLYDPFKQTLSVRSVGSGCLRDLSGQVVYMACSTGDDSASQQWQLTADGHLRSKTGLCLGLGGPETRHYLVNVTCGASKELEWKPGVSDVLSYLQRAQPLVTSDPELGYCLHAQIELMTAAEVMPGPLVVRPCSATPADNPLWAFNPKTRQISCQGSHSLCLTRVSSNTSSSSGSGITLQACMSGTATLSAAVKDQRWSLSAGKELQSGSGVCIGLDEQGRVVPAKCGTSAASAWSFGGENPLESLNPGQVLTATVANRSTVLALDVILIADDFEHNTATNFFGLRPGLSSTWKWTFHSSTQQIQLATDPKHCLSSRTDLTALTLQPCQSRGQQYFKQQAWEWYAGQLRNAGDGKCLVANGSEDLPLLKPLACNKVQASNRVSWSFGGMGPSPYI